MKVKFLPTNQEIEITPEKTLLQAALENHVDIKSICKGKLICAECRVKIVEGEANCLPPSKAELNLIGSAWQLDSRRYACQVRCFGDVTVDLTEQIQRSETARKNIRGFKSSRAPSESTAVIDTMILNEKIAEEAPGGEKPPREERQGERQSDRGGRRDQGRGGRREGKGERRDEKAATDGGRKEGGRNEGRSQENREGGQGQGGGRDEGRGGRKNRNRPKS